MRDALPEIERRGASVTVVGNGQPWQAKAFREDERISFSLWVDPEMVAYRAAGLRRGMAATMSLRTFGHAWRAMKSGHRQTKTQGDPWQLGGAFVITREGKAIFEHISTEAGDHAPIGEMLAALDRLAAAS